jgi:hypothetical protein
MEHEVQKGMWVGVVVTLGCTTKNSAFAIFLANLKERN